MNHTMKHVPKGKEDGNTFRKLHVLGMNHDLWDRVCGLGSEAWKGCERVELLVFLTRLRGTEIIPLISSEQIPTKVSVKD